MKSKAELRQYFTSLREQLSTGEVDAASAALCRRLAGWPTLQAAQTVLAYLAFRNELDVRPLFALLPHVSWVVPRIEGKRLSLHRYDPARLVRHRFGMWEPAADLPVVSPAELDIVLVPGVAYDRQGGRLGFGGGFYDRFLPTTPALRVGITYDFCLIERLPCGEADQAVDWIATPTVLFATGRQQWR